jgi:hypothetical protein
MKEELIEQILQAANLTRACEDVVKNKGAGGVDGMNVKELKSWLDQNRQQLVEQVRNCEYHAQAIRGKEIPKGGVFKKVCHFFFAGISLKAGGRKAYPCKFKDIFHNGFQNVQLARVGWVSN